MSWVHCHICNKRFDSEKSPAMPFCSERCRLIDLGKWLEERYSLSDDLECEGEEDPSADSR